MLEPELETGEPVIEVYIHTDSTEENQAVSALLATVDVENVVRQTLHTIHVEQPVTLTLVISGDTEIQALNRQYRQQDKPTDVLSFPLLDAPLVTAPAAWLWQEPEETEIQTVAIEAEKEQWDEIEKEKDTEEETASAPLATPLFVTPAELSTNLGDIMISWPTTQRQAREAGHDIADELLFLLCHGVLHLVGYDDQTEAGYTEMVRLQKEILAGFNRKG
jgi:probable rRNA maturation factor